MGRKQFDVMEDGLIERQADILELQKPRHPETVEEMSTATEEALDAVESDLTLYETITGHAGMMDHELIITETLEDWLTITDALDEAFFVVGDGALGRRLIDLVATDSLDDADLEEAIGILRSTSPMVPKLLPLLEHAARLRANMTLADIVDEISIGKVGEQHIEGQRVDIKVKSLIGLLRELSEKVTEAEEARGNTITPAIEAWKLQGETVIPQTIKLRDPFEASAESFVYWSTAGEATEKVEGKVKSIKELSHGRTLSLMYDMEQLADALWEMPKKDVKLREAYERVHDWLGKKMVYYTSGDDRDFSIYNLSMENPAVATQLIQDLDIIKHAKPALFTEMMGMNPYAGSGESRYFGSFLHKALANTEAMFERVSEKVDHIAFAILYHQLMNVDQHVQAYSGRYTQEGVAQAAAKAKAMVEAESDSKGDEAGAGLAKVLGVMLVRPAIEAQYRAEFDKMREANLENFRDEVARRIDARQTTMLTDYLANLPLVALQDVVVRAELRRVFPREMVDDMERFRGLCQTMDMEVLKPLYDQIPIFDKDSRDFSQSVVVRVANDILHQGLEIDDDGVEFAFERLSQALSGRPIYNDLAFALIHRYAPRSLKYFSERYGQKVKELPNSFYVSRMYFHDYSRELSTYSDEDRPVVLSQLLEYIWPTVVDHMDKVEITADDGTKTYIEVSLLEPIESLIDELTKNPLIDTLEVMVKAGWSYKVIDNLDSIIKVYQRGKAKSGSLLSDEEIIETVDGLIDLLYGRGGEHEGSKGSMSYATRIAYVLDKVVPGTEKEIVRRMMIHETLMDSYFRGYSPRTDFPGIDMAEALAENIEQANKSFWKEIESHNEKSSRAQRARVAMFGSRPEDTSKAALGRFEEFAGNEKFWDIISADMGKLFETIPINVIVRAMELKDVGYSMSEIVFSHIEQIPRQYLWKFISSYYDFEAEEREIYELSDAMISKLSYLKSTLSKSEWKKFCEEEWAEANSTAVLNSDLPDKVEIAEDLLKENPFARKSTRRVDSR